MRTNPLIARVVALVFVAAQPLSGAWAIAQTDSREIISRPEAERIMRIPESRALIDNADWPRKTCADADIGVAWRFGCIDQCEESNIRKLAEEWKVDMDAAMKRIEPEYAGLHTHCATLCIERCESSFRAVRDQTLADLDKKPSGLSHE